MGNFGIHHPCPEREAMIGRFADLFDQQKAFLPKASSLPQIIYRETHAMHFPHREDGAYGNRTIEKINPDQLTDDHACARGPMLPSCWVLQEQRLVGKLPFIHTFNITSGLGEMKVGKGLSKGGDCTHFCQPGVPDAYAKILYNMLSRSEQSNSVVANYRMIFVCLLVLRIFV